MLFPDCAFPCESPAEDADRRGLAVRIGGNVALAVEDRHLVQAALGRHDELVLLANAKRYPDSRIRRLCLQTVLGVTGKPPAIVPYARVLAFNDKGAELIRTMKREERNTIPILTNINKEAESAIVASSEPELFRKTLELDIRAADIWNLIHNQNRYAYSDYRQTPFRDLKGE